ncbi:AraC family transcriptional regulator [Gordonia sp. OPL2]|uniref:helix-turn-helix transcriptional regulator n=1 Tax=Gordonia sp. OPL2 TaxID=2486274 RepID=UPI0016553B81|nr:AraC family transcriptional regulator [Gordonia sp. OPL2]RPA06249.1 AraC family transcriptional regulator [Gordonia sp. OPL2]
MAENEQSHGGLRTPGGSDDVIALRTGELDSREGRAEWVSTIGHLYGQMDVTWENPGERYDAEWGGRAFGRLHVSTIRSDEQTVVRSPAMIREGDGDGYLLLLVTEGGVEITQRERRATLGRGAFAMVNLNDPFVFHSPVPFNQVAVRIPSDVMESRLPRRIAGEAIGRTYEPAGSPAILGRLLADLATTDDSVSPSVRASFASATVEMLAAALAEQIPEHGPDTQRAHDLARINRTIAEHLHDPDLSLSDVAGAAGMSLRNMQKLVSTTGTTPGGLLHRARIDRAKMLLTTTESSVAEVATGVGYLDVSHFSRTFRRLTGESPGRFRAGASDGG